MTEQDKIAKIEDFFNKNRHDDNILSNIEKYMNRELLNKQKKQKILLMMEKLLAIELQEFSMDKIYETFITDDKYKFDRYCPFNNVCNNFKHALEQCHICCIRKYIEKQTNGKNIVTKEIKSKLKYIIKYYKQLNYTLRFDKDDEKWIENLQTF